MRAGRITAMECLAHSIHYTVHQSVMHIDELFENVKEALPLVVWHHEGQTTEIVGEYPFNWRGPADFYNWADHKLRNVFSLGLYLKDYVAQSNPEAARKVVEKAQKAFTKASERVQAAAVAADAEKVLPSDGSVHPGNARQFADHKQEARAAASGIGERTQRKLDALARRAPDLLDKVRAGEMSAHRAAVEAGIVKQRTALEQLEHWWRRASDADREAFLKARQPR